jgi:hypothetical protein
MRHQRSPGTRRLLILTAVAALGLPDAPRGAEHQESSEEVIGSDSRPTSYAAAAKPPSIAPARVTFDDDIDADVAGLGRGLVRSVGRHALNGLREASLIPVTSRRSNRRTPRTAASTAGRSGAAPAFTDLLAPGAGSVREDARLSADGPGPVAMSTSPDEWSSRAAQVSRAVGVPRTRRLSVSVGTGFARGGPAPDLEAALRRNGLDDTSSGFFGGPSAHPNSDAAFGLVWFDTRYELWSSWEIGARFDRTRIGRSIGYREGSAQAPPQFVFAYYEVSTIAAVGGRRIGPLLLGAGPAYYAARTTDLHGEQSRSSSRFGLLTEAGLRLPIRTRVYVGAHLQYRLVGRAPVGPITSRVPQPLPGHPWEGHVPATLPETEARFNHWFVGFGPGLRF